MLLDICTKDFKESFPDKLNNEWSLITAEKPDGSYNMMTASWGFMGEMWGTECLAMVVRPERYTMEFIDASDYFTVSFYDTKDVHKLCGYKSGRDVDKQKESGLTPIRKNGYVLFEEARLTFVCKKLYVQPMDKNCFTVNGVADKWYNGGEMHNLIIGEIVKMLRREPVKKV